ncbi:MAG: mechanosensitive ion channel [Burkholderiaceae bacterium]|nr:mechanosensitive ion channel [Burkholderiaceae bacterium]
MASLAAPVWSQPAAPGSESAPSAEARVQAIAPADIPSQADADEKFVQAVQRRAQMSDKVRRLEQTLSRQAAALDQLSELTASSDLSQLSVQRLESLERHWLLKERALSQTRAEIARDTNIASEDAAELAARRAAWQATAAQPYLSPALVQRSEEMVTQFDRAQALLADPLAKLLDLGRKSNALSARVQQGVAEVVREVAEQDRRLVTMDTPPLWQAIREADVPDPVGTGLRRSLEIETAFARDFDAARARLLPLLGGFAVVLLPLVFWLRRRARKLVAAGQLGEAALHALARPWAAWLLLVAAAAVLYGLQGPNLRQQGVMLLAWIPVLGLLQRRMLSVIGPWAYLSAIFYFLNVVVSLLVGNPLLFRLLLLGINLLMLLTLGWHILRSRRSADEGDVAFQASTWHVVAWLACAVLAVAAASNLFGNISLSSMLVSATLESSYVALAMYAGSKVVLALFQVALAGPTFARVSARYSSSLVPAVVNLGRALLVMGWLLFTLQAFRIYRPVSAFTITVLTHEFKLGELSLSLGGVLTFALATWAAFWLAKTIRQVLAEDILPSLSLPRGVGNSVSSLTYYIVLFLGLLAALAAAGFQVGQLALIFGALGVGIGFGLQDVVRNFVAGLILMFERPIQRGDTVEVAGMLGQVREIGLRATIVTTFEGADVVVPNGMLLADKVVNWTLNGTRRRFDLNISTHYNEDPQRTMDLLVEIARSCSGVAATPAPACIMTGLAPGELQFNIRAWTKDFGDWVQVRTELAMKIRNGLAEAGIEVPKPQREVVLRTLPPEAPGAPV